MVDTTSIFPRGHMSISSLQAFSNCPFSFMMRYVLGIDPPKKPKAMLGEIFQRALNAKYDGNDPAPIIKEMEPKMRGIASLLMTKANSFTDIISLDKPYDIDIGFGVPIRFVPDVLTKTAIIENKFTTGYYNPKMVLTERQRVVYYMGVRRLFGFDPRVYYQIFNTSKKSVELVETPTTLTDIDELVGWIDTTLRQIQKCMATDRWTDGTEHGWCDWPNSCPLQARFGNKNSFKK